jgi:hypothetical protein
VAVTSADALEYYRNAILHLPIERVGSFVPGPVDVALQRAILDVSAIFGGNGFTADQIAAWPQYDAVVKLQTVFWMVASGALLDNPENQRALNATLKLLDQRDSLSQMYPDDSGLPVIPGRILHEIGFGTSKIIGPDGKGSRGEPFRDWRTGDWRKM